MSDLFPLLERHLRRATSDSWRRGDRLAAHSVCALLLGILTLVFPQSIGAAEQPVVDEPRVAIPNFWNPRGRGDRIESPQIGRSVRFLTDDEFPPLHFAGPDGNPTGFTVELARAVCERMTVSCTVQARRFDTLLDALDSKQGDVVAAAIPLTAELRARFLATRPYFRWPARFAARKDKAQSVPSAENLAGKTIGVVEGSAHAAYLASYFGKARAKTFPDVGSAEGALRRGDVDYVFADGLNLALWLGGQDSGDCCAFSGGLYLENRYFGEGIGFVTRRDDVALSRALDDTLQKLWDDGKFAEIYLRFFPISPF